MMKNRKILGMITAICLLSGSAIAPFSAFAEDSAAPLIGDANLDQMVDVADAVLIARYYAEDATANLTDAGKKNADVNTDGNVDNRDLLQIMEFIARKRTSFTAEKPAEKLMTTVDMMEGLKRSDTVEKKVDDAFIENQFDLTAKLLKQITQNAEEKENVLISPLSMSLALTMAANGAGGETLDEMQQLLGNDIALTDLDAYFYDYVSQLPSTDKAKLDIANSIWIKDDLNQIIVPDEFLQTNKNYFDAGVFRAPFNSGTVYDVNAWVSKKTNGMIEEMITEFSPLDVMTIINALYFDAEWENKYTGYQVNPGDLYTDESLDFSEYINYYESESRYTVDYLDGREDYYVQDDNAVGFVKPYAGGQYSFVGLLPNNGVTVQSYIDQMDGASLKKLMDSKKLNEDLVYTSLPKYKYSYDVELNETLKALGMKQAFDKDEADFTGLNKLGNTWIGEVLQKTAIEVNEEGTRASAVTAVRMEGGADYPPEAVFVYLNRPFIYMIVDNSTNLPFFIGTVYHPTESEETLHWFR